MYQGRRVVVVMPAYNAARTLPETYSRLIPYTFIDRIVIVDDASTDNTLAIAHSLPGVRVEAHERNMGYGANQKTCYRLALDEQADIVIMLHPDGQYAPELVPDITAMISQDPYDCVLASRLLNKHPVREGMPAWRYVGNRCLTVVQNLVFRRRLSEYHTGYRAFQRRVLESLPYATNSDGFLFDNQLLAQVIWAGFRIGEICCPVRYGENSSSISFLKSVQYGFGCLATTGELALSQAGLLRSRRFPVQ